MASYPGEGGDLEAIIKHEPEPQTRRRFIENGFAMLAAGVGAGALGGFGLTKLLEGNKSEGDPTRLSNLVDAGLTTGWKQVAVYPGFLVASRDITLFSRPTLDKDQQIDPALQDGQKLGIVRPFFINSCLKNQRPGMKLGTKIMVDATPVKPGTLGFGCQMAVWRLPTMATI